MSKPQLLQSKSSVASPTAFDLLAVELGDESEEELVSESEDVVSSVMCVELLSQLSFQQLTTRLEMHRLSLLRLPSKKQRRQLVKKRSSNSRVARSHGQEVTSPSLGWRQVSL